MSKTTMAQSCKICRFLAFDMVALGLNGHVQQFYDSRWDKRQESKYVWPSVENETAFSLECFSPNFKAQVVFHCIPHYYNYTIFILGSILLWPNECCITIVVIK